MNRTSSNPEAATCSTSSGGRRRVDGEDHERLAAFRRPRDRHVRDVDARLAEHRPDPPDHARERRRTTRNAIRGASSMSIANPSAPARNRRCSGPTVVPATSTSSPPAADDHAHEVRVVLREPANRCSETSIPRSAAMSGRVHVVHDLVDPTLERAVQRCDREQACVVLRERAVDGHDDAGGPRRRRAPSRVGRASLRAGRTGRGPRARRGRRPGCSRRSGRPRPSSAAATCSAIITPARSCASAVEPARCGVDDDLLELRGADRSTARSRTRRAPRRPPSRIGSPPRAPPRRRAHRAPR